ncbi:MAG: hypothetical protein ACLPID_21105 [Beijerinckiaceae bacterium]
MQSPKEVEEIIDNALSEIEQFMRAGGTGNEYEIRRRRAFLNRLREYLDGWTAADPCPIAYRTLYRRLPEIKEAQIYFTAFLRTDEEIQDEFITYQSKEVLKSYRSRLLSGHGREDLYAELITSEAANGEDPASMADACAGNELNCCDQ